MQGVILSAGTAQGIILGDDGMRYTFTPLGWRNTEIRPDVGMRVDFEIRGSHAVGIYPLPGAMPTPPTAPVIPPTQTLPTFPTSPSVAEGDTPDRLPDAPGEPPSKPPTKKRFGTVWWHWALAVGGALLVLGIIGAVMLGIFSGSDAGKEIARHTHEGQVYVLVEYGNDLAIFTDSGPPVTRSRLAEDVLRSYTWGQVIGDFDTDQLADVSRKARALDDSVADARDLSNNVVDILDDLDSMEANIPFLGSISAMDVIRDSFGGASEAEDMIRSLDSELNALGDNAGTLSRASGRIAELEPSSVSGEEMDTLFGDAADAALDLGRSVASIEESVSDTRDLVESLASALRSASDTPMIGDAMGDFARSVGRFAAELSALSSALVGFEAELSALGEDMKKSRDSADKTHQDDVKRWLDNPPDATWPPEDIEKQAAAVAQTPVEKSQAPAPVSTSISPQQPVQQPFNLEWHTSASEVQAGESFTLSVRMYDVQRAGEHGGISVSFPSLTEAGGSKDRHSSSIADVDAMDYTTGLSNVAFHQPGATIYHRDDNRQFPAAYLLVESDDATWSQSSDRTLRLRITPKHGGEFPIQIRGWLCDDEYTNCARQPVSGSTQDQQGHHVEIEKVNATEKAASQNIAQSGSQAPAPTAMPTPKLTAPPAPTATPATVAGRIAFSSDRDGDSNIYVMNVDGSDLTRLTDHHADDGNPRWSPDGSRIAFRSDRDGNRNIYVMNADGSGLTRLTDHPSIDVAPSWSPDGRLIAFTSDRDGNSNIYVMNADGSGVTRLTDHPSIDAVPSWSPDGRLIAFTSDQDGDSNIYVMNADGSGVTRLTDHPAGAWAPDWSPDGSRIAFMSSRDPWNIYVMNADGSDLTRLTDHPALDHYPNWSPDGSRIAFGSIRDGDPNIYVMNADGSDLTRLTDHLAGDWAPDWSPD